MQCHTQGWGQSPCCWFQAEQHWHDPALMPHSQARARDPSALPLLSCLAPGSQTAGQMLWVICVALALSPLSVPWGKSLQGLFLSPSSNRAEHESPERNWFIARQYWVLLSSIYSRLDLGICPLRKRLLSREIVAGIASKPRSGSLLEE